MACYGDSFTFFTWKEIVITSRGTIAGFVTWHSRKPRNRSIVTTTSWQLPNWSLVDYHETTGSPNEMGGRGLEQNPNSVAFSLQANYTD
jgi:hypothetical protein